MLVKNVLPHGDDDLHGECPIGAYATPRYPEKTADLERCRLRFWRRPGLSRRANRARGMASISVSKRRQGDKLMMLRETSA